MLKSLTLLLCLGFVCLHLHAEEKATQLIEMVSLKGGAFEMGGTYTSSRTKKPVTFATRQITLSPFAMARTETTWLQWKTVKEWALANGYSGYHFEKGGSPATCYVSPKGKTKEEVEAASFPSEPDLYPVGSIQFTAMLAWCNALSEMEGRTPCYYLDAAHTKVYRGSEATGNFKTADQLTSEMVAWDASGYRLPTEAEWEYACRAGSTTPYSFGDTWDDAYGMVKSNQPVEGAHCAVGLKKPNAFGLYDMHGNVWEVCWDWYAPYSSATTNPTGAETGSLHIKEGKKPSVHRVMRGGSAHNDASGAFSAHRERYWHSSFKIGFRVVTRSTNKGERQ